MGRSGLPLALLGVFALAGCKEPEPVLQPLPQVSSATGVATARINGNVGTTQSTPPVEFSTGSGIAVGSVAGHSPSGPADISFDFADSDIREIVTQVLGNVLHVNYTIDPAVHGTATLRTVRPMSRDQVLPALQALLSQNGATLVQSGELYRVVPSATVAGGVNFAGGDGIAGNVVVPLQYVSAEDLAKVLAPFAQNGARIVADPGRNVLMISAEPAARETLVALVRAFDIDILAGQSYALFPVRNGSTKDFASSLQDAFRAQAGGALAGPIRVVPMERIGAVLVIASQPKLIDDARRVYALVERARQATVRSWHVFYLQNSHANDAAYVLQQAFTPNDITATPPGQGQTSQNGGAQQTRSLTGGIGAGGLGSGVAGGIGSNALGGSTSGSGVLTGAGGGGIAGAGIPGTAGGLATSPSAGSQGGGGTGGPSPSANPLLGGLEQTGGVANPEAMRIVANEQNNALLIFATAREEDTVEAMLRKIDILPLQVRIDATIAEVTLNDALQYGTQFFFKAGGVNGILSFADQTIANPAAATLGTSTPGLVLGGYNLGGAPFVISALQAVTKVNVLSSPELLVLDNQSARLQVGAVVPYLSQTAQSTITASAPVVNSVAYQQTGVILQVTPRVNSGGLVTLDVAQDVSDVASGVTTNGLNSPTFNERSVTSRIVVQDGQTIGIAGLIRDSETRGNQGIPWLKDIPLLGALAGQQTNTRTRTELLVLITPHVIHDQRDARALTEDLRDQMINAAAVPDRLQNLKPSGSSDPNARLIRKLQP